MTHAAAVRDRRMASQNLVRLFTALLEFTSDSPSDPIVPAEAVMAHTLEAVMAPPLVTASAAPCHRRSTQGIASIQLGLEFGQLFSRFGVRVTLLQRSTSIFPHTELVLARRLTEILEREGIRVITGLRVKSLTASNASKRGTYDADGVIGTIDAEEILLAAGKTANSAGLKLETAGVVLDSRQAIKVNGFLQTSAAHICAAGDVIDAPARVEMTAGHEGTLAAEKALTGTQHSIDYDI